MFFKDIFLNTIRNEVKKKIVRVEYRVSGSWRPAVIQDKRISGNSLIITAITNLQAGNATITGLRLISDDGLVAGEETGNILKTDTQELYLKYDIPIFEEG